MPLDLFFCQICANQNTSTYVLSTGEQDRERAMILNEIHNPSTLSLLELKPGLRVLTIGCGIGLLELEIARQVTLDGVVMATDASAQQLRIAEHHKREAAHLDHLHFLEVNAFDIEKITGLFDRVHCRLVLTHLPLEQGIQIVELLYRKIAPGGFLLLEEIATIGNYFCEPFQLGYEKWKFAVQKQFSIQKSDATPGENLYAYIKQKGYPVEYTSYQPILSTKREKSILSLGILSGQKNFIQEGMSLDEIQETLKLLHQLEDDAHCFPRYNEISQIKVWKF